MFSCGFANLRSGILWNSLCVFSCACVRLRVCARSQSDLQNALRQRAHVFMEMGAAETPCTRSHWRLLQLLMIAFLDEVDVEVGVKGDGEVR